MRPLSQPSGYASPKMVCSFDELISTPLRGEFNALCWQRTLPGDFSEVIRRLPFQEGITPLEDEELLKLDLTAAGRVAVAVMLDDLRSLRELGLQPELNCIRGCQRDGSGGPVLTDVCSFHVDSATIEADTYLCTYHGACSEGLRNDEAARRVDIPETRAALLQEYGGADDEDFIEYLNDHCYDLHYAPLPDAIPYPFGLFHLWKVATAYPGSPVLPCIHRAPESGVDEPRLLLIS